MLITWKKVTRTMWNMCSKTGRTRIKSLMWNWVLKLYKMGSLKLECLCSGCIRYKIDNVNCNGKSTKRTELRNKSDVLTLFDACKWNKFVCTGLIWNDLKTTLEYLPRPKKTCQVIQDRAKEKNFIPKLPSHKMSGYWNWQFIRFVKLYWG